MDKKKGLDKKTAILLKDAYDLTDEKVRVWKEVLADEDTDKITQAVMWLTKNQAKTPRVAEVIDRIRAGGGCQVPGDARKERWTVDDLMNEIIKANSKKMEVIVERRERGDDIIYWESPYYIPKEAKQMQVNNLFFYRLRK